MTNGGDEDSGAISSNTSSVPHPSLRNSTDRWYEIPIADQLRKNLGMSKMLNIKKNTEYTPRIQRIHALQFTNNI
jgi:hypothetical protein